MRKRDIITEIKEYERLISALDFAQRALEAHKDILKKFINERAELLSPKKEAKKEAKKTAVVSKKGGKPSKIERPAKKAVKANPVKKIKKAIKTTKKGK